MLQESIITNSDQQQKMRTGRRSQYEDFRKRRIFDAKQRLFGLDMDALERQIAEKKQLRLIEAESDSRFEDQTQRQQNAVHAKALEMDKRQHINDSDLNYYRCRFQRKEFEREYDLNDPNFIKNSLPPRSGDLDLRLGVSSAQIFTGEDLDKKGRTQRQRQQQRAWLDQQVLERKEAEEARKNDDRLMRESLQTRDERLQIMANNETRMRHLVTDSIRQFNTDLAKAKKAEQERARKANSEDDMVEIYNMLTNPMLTENLDAASSHTDPNRKIQSIYRGMSEKELEKFRKEQYQQKLQHEKSVTDQKIIDKKWEQYSLNMDRDLMLKDLEMTRKNQNIKDEQIIFNKSLAKQQQLINEDKEKQHVNKITEEFYEGFNRTSR